MNPKLKDFNENDKILAKIILPESIIEQKKQLVKKDYQYYNNIGKNWLGSEEVKAVRDVMKKVKKEPYFPTEYEKNQKKAKMASDIQRMNESRFKFKATRRKNATLQYVSEQPINNWENVSETNQLVVTDKSLIKTLFSHSPSIKLRGRAENAWNDFTNVPEKAVKLACPPKLLRLEEKAIKLIQEKDQKLEFFDNMKKEWLEEMKKESKQKLELQHMKTSILMSKSRGLEETKEKVQNLKFVQSKSELQEPEIKQKEANQSVRPFSSSGRQEVLRTRPLSSITVKSEVINDTGEISRTEKLSKPRKIYFPECELRNKDLQGLYLADIPLHSFEYDNNAYSKLLGKSNIFKENLSEFKTNTRPSSSFTHKLKTPEEKIKTNFKYIPAYKFKEIAIQYRTFDDFNKEMDQFSQNNGDLKELAQFEKAQEKSKSTGFSKTSLEDASKLSTVEGFRSLRNQRTENQQYPKKKINS